MRRSLAIASMMSLLVACAGGRQLPYEPPPERPGIAQHASRSQQLAAHMREIRQRSQSQLDQVLEGLPHQRDREALASLATALSESAATIAGAADDLPLDAKEREEFLFLAEVLERRSRTVAIEAPFATMPSLYQQVQEIERTCDHCHGRFRIPRDAGDADSGGGSPVG